MAVSTTFFDADVVVVDARTDDRAWLQAADVIVGKHRDRRRACVWMASMRRRFPGCVVVVAWSRQGRWLLLGWPGHTLHVEGGPFDRAHAAALGRLAYQLWVCGGEERS